MVENCGGSAPEQIPIVNYLELGGAAPHLVATECDACAARYLGNRVACARCGHRAFSRRALPNTGTVGSFTIIHRAAAGVRTPFVSALVDLDDGTCVKANLIDCAPDLTGVALNMKVELHTFDAGVDDNGVVAVAFGFAPVRASREETR
jgi:uncharacterized OB-fold protein